MDMESILGISLEIFFLAVEGVVIPKCTYQGSQSSCSGKGLLWSGSLFGVDKELELNLKMKVRYMYIWNRVQTRDYAGDLCYL